MENSYNNLRINPVFVLVLLLLLAAIVYYPALDSLFLLDDLLNLKGLADIESRGMGYYLFGSNAGPGGRPLSLLTFALQHTSWPADPFAFKLINLFLHLGNGALIFYICILIFPGLGLNPSSRTVFAVLVTALWLLHPLHLSTVLYVVQRMTQLATLFMLLGTVVYLSGRKLYLEGKTRKGLMISLSGVPLCMVMAVLSKEIGILLPLYLLILEFTLLADGQSARKWRIYNIPFLVLPLMIVSLYLINSYDGFLAAYQIRNYTVGQRLMTETNVLVDYLKSIFVPVSGAFSIFHDDYEIATGLLSPPMTLFSISAILLLLIYSLAFRKHAKVLSFAVLWFFAGHILESSFIGLEIYFEHRNYLPSLGIIILILWGLIKISGHIRSGLLRSIIVPSYLLIVLAVTLMEVHLWSHPYLQASEWARQHPQSKRALNNLLNINLVLGNKEEADKAIKKLRNIDNHDIYPTIKTITIRSCFDRETLMESDWVEYNNRAAEALFRGTSLLSELEYLIYQFTRNHCNGLNIDKMAGFIDALISNPEFIPTRGALHEVATTFAVLRGDLDVALTHINRSLQLSPSIDRRIYKLRILVGKQDMTESISLLGDIKNQLRKMPRELLFYRDTITRLEQQLSNIENTGL